jgi:integrase
MPRLIHRLPQARLHKPSGQARVRIDGREHYLGRFGTPEAKQAYQRLMAEHLANNRQAVAGPVQSSGPAVLEVMDAHRKHAEIHYRRRDGSETGERENYRLALRPLRQLYGRLPAAEFGPLELRAVRESMIRTGKLSRTTINARINRIRRVFKWAASMAMIPGRVYQDLMTVPPLLEGRTPAKEADGVRSVDLGQVQRALPHMPAPVAAMVQVQVLTGCRVGEIVVMRGVDLRPGEPNWTYIPPWHKNQWRGQSRHIFLGPKAQEIVKPFLGADPQAFLFNPQEVVAELRRRRKGGRPPRITANRYDRRTYRQAIIRACRKAGIEPWSPLQLRHAAATKIRESFGLEAAQVILGHSRVDSTQLYAEKNMNRASEIIAEIG